MIDWLMRVFEVENQLELTWIFVGLAGQLLFTARFLVQWITSERQRKSVIPLAFWFFSMGGGIILFSYAVYRWDPVFMLGQSFGLVVYSRNLWLIYAERRADRA